jgi:hypothetical protein
MKFYFSTLVISLLSLTGLFGQIYTTNGTPAAMGGTCYCMADGLGSSAAQVWQDNGIKLAYFTHPNEVLRVWESEVFLGTNDGGGHGIAFLIQAESNNAGGNEGAPLGYGGTSAIVPSIAIEIDTYANTFDPTTADHLAIHLQGNHKTPMTGTVPVALPNMEDGAYHNLRVTWQYNKLNPAASTLTATVDGIYTVTANLDISFLFNSTRPIYVGFTSGTNGIATNQQKVSFGAIGSTGTCSSLSLPVELLSFEVSALNTQEVELSWATAWEENNDYFEVLRSTDAQMWQTVAQVDGAGNSEEVRQYQLTDYVPNQGKIYYQLKQVDFNGNFSYSQILQVDAGFQQDFFAVPYPNPAADQPRLSITTKERNQVIQLEMFDILGAKVYETLLPAVNVHTQEIELPVSGLEPGIYVIRIGDYLDSHTSRLIVSP